MPPIQATYFMLGAFCGVLASALAFALAFMAARKAQKRATALPENVHELRECYELLLKTARRCARDLRHATQLIDRDRWGDLKDSFHARHDHYETVLGGTNDYRIRLHREVESLYQELADLRAAPEAATKPL